MVSKDEVTERLIDYLASKISLDELDDWSAEVSIDIHNNPDQAGRELVYSIRGLLNRHEDDDSEGALKQDLIEAMYPSPSLQIAEFRATRATEEIRAAA